MKWDWLLSNDRGEWPERPSPRETTVGVLVITVSMVLIVFDPMAARTLTQYAFILLIVGLWIGKFGFIPPWYRGKSRTKQP
jgi:hypothetical protein